MDCHLKLYNIKIDDCFRRLIKGTNRSQERDRLISWFEQLKIFTPLVFQEGFESEFEVPQSNRDGNGNATPPGIKIIKRLAIIAKMEAK